MSVRSHDVAKDIATLALRQNARFDGDILEEVLGYCWDQLCWIRTDGELAAIRDSLEVGE